MSNTKLKVGDRVRLIDGIFCNKPSGSEGTVILIDGSKVPYWVQFGDDKKWCQENHIELIEPTEPTLSLPKQTLIDLAETSQAAKDIILKEFPDLFPKPVLIKQEIIETVDEDWVAGFAVGKQDCLRVNDSNYTASIINDNGAAYIKFARK